MQTPVWLPPHFTGEITFYKLGSGGETLPNNLICSEKIVFVIFYNCREKFRKKFGIDSRRKKEKC